MIDNPAANLPNYTILYSGLAANNPGQKMECENSNFSYYLMYMETAAPNLTSFTGICVPTKCATEDVERIIAPRYNATTIDFPEESLDGLAWTGLILFFVYVALIISVMMVNSFKDDKVTPEGKPHSETKIEINMSVNDR